MDTLIQFCEVDTNSHVPIRFRYNNHPSTPVCGFVNPRDDSQLFHALQLCLHLGQQRKCDSSGSWESKWLSPLLKLDVVLSLQCSETFEELRVLGNEVLPTLYRIHSGH